MSITNYLQPLNQYALNVVRINKDNIPSLTSSLAGTGNLSADLTSIVPMSATIEGIALVFAAAYQISNAAALMRGVGTLTANMTYDAALKQAEPMHGTGDLTAAMYQAIFGKFHGTAEFTADLSDFREGGLSITVNPATREPSGDIIIKLDERD